MGGKSSAKLKILYLMDIFISKTDEENILTANELCCELEKNYGITAERKSIYADIETLQEYGMDIIFVRNHKKGYFLGQRDYELAEIRLLIDAVQSAKFITHKKTKELVEKINKQVSNSQKEMLESQIYIDNRVKCVNEEIYYNIDVLNRAISGQKKVELVYIKHSVGSEREVKREEKELCVNPYVLIWSNDHYYLVGNNPKYENLMHLRIDRMKKVTILNEQSRHFSEVSDFTCKFDAAVYAQNVFNMYTGEIIDVELVCKNELIDNIIDRFGNDVIIKYHDRSSFFVRHRAAMSEGLISWILQYGGMIKVIKPAILRDAILSKAKSITEIYKGTT
ncbi:MAG: WYL domain-containing protein [Oscillospiraceae bacterium]|jgi:predicted DNA-binding transcriptional regulator YafY|nr:WYL domain-containing protein [Oscillospiraceae bacterium]